MPERVWEIERAARRVGLLVGPKCQPWFGGVVYGCCQRNTTAVAPWLGDGEGVRVSVLQGRDQRSGDDAPRC